MGLEKVVNALCGTDMRITTLNTLPSWVFGSGKSRENLIGAWITTRENYWLNGHLVSEVND